MQSKELIDMVEKDIGIRLPEEVTVLGKKISIIYTDDTSNPWFVEPDDGGVYVHDRKLIVINMSKWKTCVDNICELEDIKRILRHEIIHSFFCSSGLQSSCEFANNEMLVDWVANMLPDMAQVMGETLLSRPKIKEEDYK